MLSMIRLRASAFATMRWILSVQKRFGSKASRWSANGFELQIAAGPSGPHPARNERARLKRL
jgi:hypothetical protein